MPRSVTSKKRLVAQKRAIVNHAKDRPCADCGGRFPPEALDFDHVRGLKKCSVSRLVNTGHSVIVLRNEMALCDVVCANCHRTRTRNRA